MKRIYTKRLLTAMLLLASVWVNGWAAPENLNVHEVLKVGDITFRVSDINDEGKGECVIIGVEDKEEIVLTDGVDDNGDPVKVVDGKLVSPRYELAITMVGSLAISTKYDLKRVDLSKATRMQKLDEKSFYINAILETVVLPESIEDIWTSAFEDNTNLKNINFPSSLKNIGMAAFKRCYALEVITLPAGVTILQNAFENCQKLRRIVSLGEAPPHAFDSSFDGVELDKIMLRVPSSDAIVAYQSDSFWWQIAQYGITTNDEGEDLNIGPYCFHIEKDGEGELVAKIVGRNTLNPTPFPEDCLNSPYLTFIQTNYKVTSIGDNAFQGDESTEPFDFSRQLFWNITLVGQNAFSKCKAEDIKFHWDTMETIGSFAFEKSNIHEFQTSGRTGIIGGGAFLDCGKLEHVKSMGMHYLQELTFSESCFMGCSALKTVEISSGTKAIHKTAFASCPALQRVTVEFSTPPTIPDNVFKGSNRDATLRVPEGSEDAYRNAQGWNYFSKINFSDMGATFEDDVLRYEIGDVMGNTCAMIAGFSSSFNGTVAKLPARFVEYEGVKFPVEKVKDKAFYGNEALTAVDLTVLDPTPADDEYYWWRLEIGDMAFAECTNLTSYKCDVTRNIGEQAFANTGLTSVRLPGMEYTLGVQAFYECGNLTTVYIHGNYSLTLGDQAFANCPKLSSFFMPDLYGSMMDKVFYGDEALTSIVLPEYLYFFGVQTFRKCKNLRKVVSWNPNPDDIDEDTFLGIPEDAKLFVPAGTVELYKSKKGWNQFGENIIDISSIPTGIEEIHSWSEERGVRSGWYTLDGQRLNTQPTKRGVYLHNGRKIINIGR